MHYFTMHVPMVSGAFGHGWVETLPAAVSGQNNPQSESVSRGHTGPEMNKRTFIRNTLDLLHTVHMLLYVVKVHTGKRTFKYYFCVHRCGFKAWKGKMQKKSAHNNSYN